MEEQRPLMQLSTEELRELFWKDTDKKLRRGIIMIFLGLYERGEVDENGQNIATEKPAQKRREIYFEHPELLAPRVFEKVNQTFLAQVAAECYRDYWMTGWIVPALREEAAFKYINERLKYHKPEIILCRLGACVWTEEGRLTQEQSDENYTKERFEKQYRKLFPEK